MIKSWLIGVIFAVCAAIGFKFFDMYQEIESLQTTNTGLKLSNDILKLNNSSLGERLRLFTEADEQNKSTIAKLQQERADSLAAIERMSKHQTKTNAQLDTVILRIESAPSDDNGPVAPVLRETVREIQQLRRTQ
jgi:regulator of replication initiation timing